MITPALIKNLPSRYIPDGTGNYHLRCPWCKGQKKKLYIKATSKTLTLYQCWKCGRKGGFVYNSDVYQRILFFNTNNPTQTDVHTINSVSVDHKKITAVFNRKLLNFLVKTRKFSIRKALYIIKKFKLSYNEGRVYFHCFMYSESLFSFYKDTFTGLYKNAIGKKFMFNFNALQSDRHDYVFIVEGVFDALRLATSDIPAIALLGKAFGTTAYLIFCKNINAKRVFIMLDGDIQKNEDRKLMLQLKKNIKNEIYIVKIKESSDPDEYFQKTANTKKLKAAINNPTAKVITI